MEENRHIEKLYRRFLAGECTETEVLQLLARFNAADNEQLCRMVEQELLAAGDAAPATPEEEAVLDTLHHGIKARMRSDTGDVLTMSKRPGRWRAAAATVIGILLLSGGSYLWLHHRQDKATDYVVVKTRKGQVEKIVLPDSSVAWLNAVSALKYPRHFSRGSREVILEEGEAFFSVKQEAARPFQVGCDRIRITVLGTSFNVNAYRGLPGIRVAVKDGKVRVADSSLHTMGTLTADQELVYTRADGSFTRNRVNAANLSDWKEGYLVLDNAGFDEVAMTLENAYGIEIDRRGFHDKNFHYTIRLNKKLSIGDIMEILNGIHPMQYRISDSTIVITSK